MIVRKFQKVYLLTTLKKCAVITAHEVRILGEEQAITINGIEKMNNIWQNQTGTSLCQHLRKWRGNFLASIEALLNDPGNPGKDC